MTDIEVRIIALLVSSNAIREQGPSTVDRDDPELALVEDQLRAIAERLEDEAQRLEEACHGRSPAH